MNPNRSPGRQRSPLTMSNAVERTNQKRLMPIPMAMDDMKFVVATVIEESVDHRMGFA